MHRRNSETVTLCDLLANKYKIVHQQLQKICLQEMFVESC